MEESKLTLFLLQDVNAACLTWNASFVPDHTVSIKQKVNVKVAQLCQTLCDPMDYAVHGILQARMIFPTQGLNPGLPHCRWIL